MVYTKWLWDEAGMNEILIGLGSEIEQDNIDVTTGPLFMDRSNDSSVIESNFPIELYSNAEAEPSLAEHQFIL